MKQNTIRKVLISTLAVAAIPAALLYTDYAISNQPETVAVKPVVALPKVTIERFHSGDNASVIEAFGEVKSSDTLSLLSEVSGKVIWRSEQFRTGEKVAKGTLLARVDDTAYKVELTKAQKSLADAELALIQEKRKYKRAEENWKRSGIKEKPTALALRQPQLNIAQAQYNAAKEQVVYAESKLRDTLFYAPFDAVITARSVSEGSYLSQGSKVGELKSSQVAEVNIALSEQEWQQIPANTEQSEVQIYSTNRPELFWNGRINHLSMVVDSATRTRTLTVEVDKPLDQSSPLLFGSFVKVQVSGKVQKNSFSIPASSVTADGYIWLEQNGQLNRVKAETLYTGNGRIAISKGDLPDTINLIRKPLSNFVQGMQVTPVKSEMVSLLAMETKHVN